MKPLLRYYEYTQGVQVHVASYPSMFDTAKESPVYSMTAAASQAACQMMAMEGGTFVLLATPIISDANREKAGMANAPNGKVVSQKRCLMIPASHVLYHCFDEAKCEKNPLTATIAICWLLPDLWSRR